VRQEAHQTVEEQMNYSTDERRKESLRLLQDVAAYLKRLPPNALTREVVARIESHLAAPDAKLTLQRPAILEGDAWHPAGIPHYSARVVDNELSFMAHQTLPAGQVARLTLEKSSDGVPSPFPSVPEAAFFAAPREEGAPDE
jgi:hypothetical protein